jgi:hypothetical protein
VTTNLQRLFSGIHQWSVPVYRKQTGGIDIFKTGIAGFEQQIIDSDEKNTSQHGKTTEPVYPVSFPRLSGKLVE